MPELFAIANGVDLALVRALLAELLLFIPNIGPLPPALTVSVQVLLGVLAGALGVILATPLTVALMTMTRMWCVEEILGDHGSQSD